MHVLIYWFLLVDCLLVNKVKISKYWAFGQSLAKTCAWEVICLKEIGCLLRRFSIIQLRSLFSISGYLAFGPTTIFFTSGEPAKVLNLENSTTQFLNVRRGIPVSDDILSVLFENFFQEYLNVLTYTYLCKLSSIFSMVSLTFFELL